MSFYNNYQLFGDWPTLLANPPIVPGGDALLLDDLSGGGLAAKTFADSETGTHGAYGAGAPGRWVTDTTIKLTGAHSVKSLTTADQLQYGSHISQTDLRNYRYIGMWVYLESIAVAAAFTGVGINIYSTSSSTNRNRQLAGGKSNGADRTWDPGWHFLCWPIQDFAVVSGSYDHSAFSKLGYEVNISSAALPVRVDSIWALKGGWRPKILIVADDAGVTDYTKLFATLQPLGLHGTSFIITTSVDGGEANLTLSQILEMRAAGWDFGMHDSNGEDNLSTLSPSEIHVMMIKAKAYIRQYHLSTNYSYAYPQGVYNDAIRAVIDAHCSLVRTSKGTIYTSDEWEASVPGENLKLLRSWFPVATNTVEDWKTQIDAQAVRGRSLCIGLHLIVDSGATGPQVNLSVVEEVAEYLAAYNGVRWDVVTCEEYAKGLTSARWRRRLIGA